MSAFNEDDAAWPIKSKIAVGDIVYIYLTAPHKKIGFVSTVIQVNIPNIIISMRTKPYIKNIDQKTTTDKPFMLLGEIKSLLEDSGDALSLERLRSHGLNGMLMGARKLDNNPELFTYITGALNEL